MSDWEAEYVDNGAQVGYDIRDPNGNVISSSRVNRENAVSEQEIREEMDELTEKYRQNQTYANVEGEQLA